MPTWRPLRIKGSKLGLNTADRPEDLSPGEATVANNVEFSSDTVKKRGGFRTSLKGDLDAVVCGGVPSASLYVVGDEYWLNHWAAVTGTPSSFASDSMNYYERRDFYHARQGLIVIPEDDLSTMRLDVQSGDPDWAIEFPIWTDSLPRFIYSPLLTSTNDSTYIVVAAKSQNTGNSVDASTQWAVRIITSGDRYQVVLTLYEGSAHTAGTDFYYQSGAERGWVQPGRRMWFAWKYTDGGSPTITSYYWIEGATSVVSSTQAVTGTLRTNGVGGSTYPISIGRRLTMANKDSAARHEFGFNGVVGDLRFWDDTSSGTLTLPANFGTVTASPPATTDWYVESEIPNEQLTTDSSVEPSNIAQTTSLRAYWQFKPELVGTTSSGTAVSSEQGRFIRPRYRSTGATTPLAWLTGADGTWLPGSGALGDYGIGLTPAGPSGQLYAYGDALTQTMTSAVAVGDSIYRGGIRVPNGYAYIKKATSSATVGSYEWPGSFSVRVAVRLDALPSSTSTEAVIWEMAVARQGATVVQYAVRPVLQLLIVNVAGTWKFRWRIDSAGTTYTNVDSTTVPVEGSTYTLAATARWYGSTGTARKMAIYVNGSQESTSSTAGSKPAISQASAVDATSSNEDDEDGRDGCYPMSVGYTNETVSSAMNTPPNPYSFRFGANSTSGIGVAHLKRPYWAAHNNETKKDANSGVPYRGSKPFVGVIGSLQIWRDYELNESEARRFADRSPNAQEIAAYGQQLASSWDMDEGQGTLIYDRGYLKNHIPFNPLPTVQVQTGVFGRQARQPLLGIAQRRERQIRSGVPVREVYAIGTGTVHKMVADSGGDNYLTPIGRCRTPQEYDPTNVSLELPTWFSFSDQLYFCTGLGPVKRITNGKVLDAGLTPVYGEPGSDQTNLGWRELDRDGTLQLLGQDAASAAETVFVEGGKYGYTLTYYDPESGIESPPSRAMYLTAINSGTSAGNGLKSIGIINPPKSPQKNVTKYRVYRTVKDGSEFKFLDEFDVIHGWVDTHGDRDLGSPIDSQLNFPPPQNVRIGISFGARAIYAGVKEAPNTIYYSLLGSPGSVPPQYQITFPEQVTALLPYNDRVLVGTTNRWYALFDSGGDIAIDSADSPPIQYAVITEETGCLGHNACVMIPGVGWVFPGERGIYATNGSEFKYLSNKIEPYWRTINFNAGSRMVGVHNQRDNQYIMFHCLGTDTVARNTRAVVFDYTTGAFSTFSGLNVLNAGVIEDEDTGVDRVVVTDYLGNLWEFNPPDLAVTADGVAAAPYTGSVVSAKKDALGSGNYTRIQLSSSNQLPTDGSGLRGVMLYVHAAGVPWNTEGCRIVWNDANWVFVESANAKTSSPSGQSWKLGPIQAQWVSGKMDLGAPTLLKKAAKFQIEYGEAGGSQMGMAFTWDEQSAQTFSTLSPSRRFDTVSPILGRGRNCQVGVYDSLNYGGETNNPWELREIEWDFFVKGRSTFIGS